MSQLPAFASTLFVAAVASCCALVAAPVLAQCDDSQAGYVQPEMAQSDTVLIFVHGLSGDPSSTWRYGPNAQTAWPCLLKNDRQFAKANVFLYGYPTGFIGQQPSIADVAQRMLEELGPVMRRHQQVVFVVHSLGGLVTTQMLMKAGAAMAGRDLHRRTKLVMFFGSPGGGSAAAQVVAVVKPAVQVQELANAHLLDAIVARWKESDIGKKGRCYAETRPMGGMFVRTVDWLRTWLPGQQPALIVTRQSAFALCGGMGREIAGSDHGEIVKPLRSQHESYKALSTQFHACVRTPMSGSVGATLAGTRLAEAVLLWRDRFERALHAARRDSSSSDLLTAWLHQPEHHNFLQTPDPDPQAPPAFRRGVVGAGSFLVGLRDGSEFISQGTLEQVGVAYVKDLPVVVEDADVRFRVDELLQAGRLRNEDLAVVLEDTQGTARWLLWLAQPEHASDTALLRGFTRLPKKLDCDQPAD